MKPLVDSQHSLMGALLEMPRPGTAAEIQVAYLSDYNPPSTASVKQRLDRLVEWGWLVKSPGPSTGFRGKPPVVYAPAPGAREAWDAAEAKYREASLDDELLA